MNFKSYLLIFVSFVLLSCSEETSNPVIQPVNPDKIEFYHHYVDSIGVWQMVFKDTFKLSEPPFIRINLIDELRGDNDFAYMYLINQQEDTVYYDRVKCSLIRDDYHIVTFKCFRTSSSGVYKASSYFIRNGQVTNLPSRKLYAVSN